MEVLAASLLPNLLGGLFGKGIVLPGTRPRPKPQPSIGRGIKKKDLKKDSKRTSTTRNVISTSVHRNMEFTPLSNIQIDKIMKKVNNYVGTFSKDMLPKKIDKNASLIVNLQDYFAGGGTHWIAIYNSKI